MRQYRKKKQASVIAIQVDLDTTGFEYQKWGGTQKCKRGDWLVSNQGDTYTVDQETFTRTYRQISPGVYEKASAVWAEQADKSGTIKTKEGVPRNTRLAIIWFTTNPTAKMVTRSRVLLLLTQ